MDSRLFLIDAYSMIYRAYYALIRAPRFSSKGVDTSAIFGFVNCIEDLIKKEHPTHLAVCFDPKGGSTFRHELYKDYKANRDAQPEGITVALPYIKEILRAMRIPVFEIEHYEADDVIGTLAVQAERAGITTYMMTMDKDYGQLVTDKIIMYRPALRGEGFEIRGPKEVCERYGIDSTRKVIDILALEGDSSDNVPGVPKVGEKTAAKLIAEWGTVENILANLESFKGKLKENLEASASQLLLNKELVTINTEVPVTLNLEAMRMEEPDVEALRAIYTELDFRSFLAKLKKPDGDGAAPVVAASLFDAVTADEERQVQAAIVTAYTTLHTAAEIEQAIDAALSQPQVGIALYTIGDEAMIAKWRGMALATEPGHAVYFAYSADVKDAVTRLLGAANTMVVSADVKRDMVIAACHGIDYSAKFFDISLAHYLLQSERSHDLTEIAHTYLGYDTYEYHIEARRRKRYVELTADEAEHHMCEMADVALRLQPVLAQEIEAQGMTALMTDIEFPIAPVLARMERVGVRIDPIELHRQSVEMTERMHTLEGKAYEMAGGKFNIGSPTQVGDVLFDRLKIDPNAKKTKTGSYSTTEAILEKYAAQHPIVPLILEIRKLKKLLATYIDTLPELINPKTGHIHTTFNQTITATGRISSSNPNLQNIPVRSEDGREIRRAFIADPGCLILSADYSQIELRLIADISGDPDMIEAFRSGKDIHTATAAKIYGIPLDQVTDNQRRNAKTANFGIIYGISAFGLSQSLGIPRAEAKELIEGYMNTYPQIKRYIEQAIEKARSQGYVETIKGRKRQLPDINSRNAVVRGYAERNAVNAPLQGSAADIIKIAMIRIDAQMRQRGMRSAMIMQVHDELIFNVVPDELNALTALVTDEMQNAYSGQVPLIVSAGVANNWLEAH